MPPFLFFLKEWLAKRLVQNDQQEDILFPLRVNYQLGNGLETPHKE